MSKIEIEEHEYKGLLESQAMLICLENAGVDSWPGIDMAQEEYEEYLKDIEDKGDTDEL